MNTPSLRAISARLSKLSTPARFALCGGSIWLAFSLLTRIALLLMARHDVSWNASLPGAFAIGFVFDLCGAVFAALPWLLVGALLPARLLQHRSGRIAIMVAIAFYTSLLVFISVSECVFWEEFGARFNFIAVDYLVWTQEVWDNIWQSYPMVWIGLGIALVGCAVAWASRRFGILEWLCCAKSRIQQRVTWPLAGLASATLIVLVVSQSAIPAFGNQFNAELAKNGSWSFFTAFRHMEIDYPTWYRMLPEQEAQQCAQKLLTGKDEPVADAVNGGLARDIASRGTEKRCNVITIFMESLSGDYMSYLGNDRGLTPNLDRLTGESLFFRNLYATGTRTVRGMEAMTLSLPPTPGQAIIYRPEGTYLTTSFSPFVERGYDCAFLYGGDGRFDFMNRYFSTAGCRIMDVNAWEPDDVTFETAWGACDEDLFHRAVVEADRDQQLGKPFHLFCMTTSNHRPYDFPEGRIDLPVHGREPAVKYADWAVGNFLEEASHHEWYKNTIFVICSDHCASSAGKMEIDVTKYHIPAMIYAPGLIEPKTVDTLCSQIDVMPTLFGLMNWGYQSRGYGQDLLAPENANWGGRAFVSNYQKIALLRDKHLAILKPNREVTIASCDLVTGALQPLAQDANSDLLRDTVAYYQTAAWLFSTGRLKLNQDAVAKP